MAIVPPKKPGMISPPGPGNLPPTGMVSSHGPGSGAPPTAFPRQPRPVNPPGPPLMPPGLAKQDPNQQGIAHYQRRINDLNGNTQDPRYAEYMKGIAHYQRQMKKGGTTPPGPPLMPPRGGSVGGINPPGPPNLPPGGPIVFPMPDGVGPGPMTTGGPLGFDPNQDPNRQPNGMPRIPRGPWGGPEPVDPNLAALQGLKRSIA